MKKLALFFLFSSLLLSSCQKDNVVNGCIDPSANNYNASANTDDGSCLYPPTYPQNFSLNFNIFNFSGNFECGYVDIILKKNDGSNGTVKWSDVCANGQYEYTAPFSDLTDLGFEEGDSLKVDVEDCNWINYDSHTMIVPTNAVGTVVMNFPTFVVGN